MKTWLEETAQLDLSQPRLRITAQKLTQSRQTLAARAAALQDFVRRLPFTAAPGLARCRASEVMEHGEGDCHTKGVLFTALCRAAGLPARLRFVRVQARFLGGVLAEPPAAMTHAVAQVHVAGRWLNTDGYVVDPVLFAHARHLLRSTGMDCGWGIVHDARGVWQGDGDCIQQYREEDLLDDYGVYDDVQHFLACAPLSAPRPLSGAAPWLGSALVNWRVRQIRKETLAVA